MSAVADETMWIKLNTGEVVERPYREAVRLLSRRLADVATDEEREAAGGEAPAGEPVDTAAYEEAYSGDELRDLAKTNDLATSGNKGELVARLLEANVELSTGEAPASSGATPEDVPGENVSSPDEQS